MKTINYDVLPLTQQEKWASKRWILRCEANGRAVLRSQGESKRQFIEQCEAYCAIKSKPGREAVLRIPEEE